MNVHPVPQLVAEQGIFVPLEEEVTVARAQLALAQTPHERFAFAALIQNLRQFQLNAVMLIIERAEGEPGFDEYIAWAPGWSDEAKGDLREMDGIKDEAMRGMSPEEAGEALANGQKDFLRIQERVADKSDFRQTAEDFDRAIREMNPPDDE